MEKYHKIFIAICKNNFVKSMEFRSSFFIALIVTICQIFLQLWLVNVVFQYTNHILDWSRADIFVLIGIFRVVKGFFDLLMRTNLFNFPDLISTGDFDFILTKPVNSLFLMSFRNQVMSELSGPISGIGILIYALNISHFSYTPFSLMLVLILLMVGLICFYSFFAIASTLAIYVTRLTAINEFQDVVSQTVRFPLDIITRKNFLGELLIFPLVLFFTLPAKIILNKIPAYNLFIEVFSVLIIFVFLIKFWQFSLNHYSSASS